MMAPRKRSPSIEQRLEAITQTMELLVGMQLSTERELKQLASLSRTMLTIHEARIKKLERNK